MNKKEEDALRKLIDERIAAFFRHMLQHNGTFSHEVRASAVRETLKDVNSGLFAVDNMGKTEK